MRVQGYLSTSRAFHVRNHSLSRSGQLGVEEAFDCYPSEIDGSSAFVQSCRLLENNGNDPSSRRRRKFDVDTANPRPFDRLEMIANETVLAWCLFHRCIYFQNGDHSHSRVPHMRYTLFLLLQHVGVILVRVAVVRIVAFLFHACQSFDGGALLNRFLQREAHAFDFPSTADSNARTQWRRRRYLCQPGRVLSLAAYHGSECSEDCCLSSVLPSKQSRSKSRSSSGSISCDVRAGCPLFGLASKRG